MSVEKRKPHPTRRLSSPTAKSTKRPAPVNEAASAAVSNHKYVLLYYIKSLHLNDIGKFDNIYVSHHGIKTCIYFKWKSFRSSWIQDVILCFKKTNLQSRLILKCYKFWVLNITVIYDWYLYQIYLSLTLHKIIYFCERKLFLKIIETFLFETKFGLNKRASLQLKIVWRVTFRLFRSPSPLRCTAAKAAMPKV
jgi:hypothetical protein